MGVGQGRSEGFFSVSGSVWAPLPAYTKVPGSLLSAGDLSLSIWASDQKLPSGGKKECKTQTVILHALLHCCYVQRVQIRRWLAAWALRDKEAFLAPPLSHVLHSPPRTQCFSLIHASKMHPSEVLTPAGAGRAQGGAENDSGGCRLQQE